MFITLKKHLWYYVSLIALDILGLILVSLVSFDHRVQLTVVIFMTIIGTAWAIVHHYIEHDLHTKIVLEYVLFGVLGISIAFFLIR